VYRLSADQSRAAEEKMTFDFDEDELDLLRRALDNYAAYEHSQLRDDGAAKRLLERIASPRKGPGKVTTGTRNRAER